VSDEDDAVLAALTYEHAIHMLEALSAALTSTGLYWAVTTVRPAPGSHVPAGTDCIGLAAYRGPYRLVVLTDATTRFVKAQLAMGSDLIAEADLPRSLGSVAQREVLEPLLAGVNPSLAVWEGQWPSAPELARPVTQGKPPPTGDFTDIVLDDGRLARWLIGLIEPTQRRLFDITGEPWGIDALTPTFTGLGDLPYGLILWLRQDVALTVELSQAFYQRRFSTACLEITDRGRVTCYQLPIPEDSPESALDVFERLAACVTVRDGELQTDVQSLLSDAEVTERPLSN
jgi:hypothetical protein